MADWDAAIARVQPDKWTAERFRTAMDERPDIMHRLVYDIFDTVKTEEERERGEVRVGRRPRRHPSSLEEVWDTVMPDPFSLKPFPEAMSDLLNGRSQRQFAGKVPCHQTTLSRMMSGALVPDLSMLERIAAAAGVPATYFAEYRAGAIAELVVSILNRKPNMSVAVLRRVRKGP